MNEPLCVEYAMGWVGLREHAEERFGKGVQVWYTERNGDSIFCVLPEGSTEHDLPWFAKGYRIREWIRPEDEFRKGMGVMRPANA